MDLINKKHNEATLTKYAHTFTCDNWNDVCIEQRLSEQFIEQFQNEVEWIYISQHQTLSPGFIDKFSHKVDWEEVSKYQTLSEELMEKFQNCIDWDLVSEYQELSEPFIKKWKDALCLRTIAKYQVLSPSMVVQLGLDKYLLEIIQNKRMKKIQKKKIFDTLKVVEELTESF